MDTKSKDTVHYKYYREITLDKQFKEVRDKIEKGEYLIIKGSTEIQTPEEKLYIISIFGEEMLDEMHGESGYTKRELQSIRRFLKGL